MFSHGLVSFYFRQYLIKVDGVNKVKQTKKIVCPKSNEKMIFFLYGHKKIDSKYLEI
jgi:hypothetical protein